MNPTILHIDLYNQWFSLSAPGQSPRLLYAIQGFISYNRAVEDWERKNGVKFDIQTSAHRVDLARNKYTPAAFSNYLWHLETGKYRNLTTGDYFPRTFMDKGNIPLRKIERSTGKLSYRVGLLELVLKSIKKAKFTKEFGDIEVTLTDLRENLINWTHEPVYEVGDFTLRPDQAKVLDSIRATMQDEAGGIFHSVLVDLAVGFGKTILMGALVRNIQDYNVVFFFRERNLCLQAIDDYLEMGFDVGTIVSNPKQVDKYLDGIGQQRRPKHGVVTGFTIVMVQTLQSGIRRGTIEPEAFVGVNGIFVDECEEGYTGDKTQQVFDLFKPGIQVGYSGTPLDSPHKRERLLTLELFGSQIYKITVAENNANGVTLPANVRFHLHRMDPNRYQTGNGKDRGVGAAKIDAVYYSGERYRLMKKALLRALKSGKQAMVYFGHAPIEVGEFLYTQMGKDSDFAPYGIGFVTGDVEVPDRAAIYKKFGNYELRIIVANRVVRRGLNVPEIQCMVNWEATDNKSSIVQAIIGRPCRRNGEDESFEVIEFYDEGHGEVEQLSRTRLGVMTHPDIGANVTYDYKADDLGYPVQA